MPTLELKRWLPMMSAYMIEIMNFPKDASESYSTFVGFASLRSGLAYQTVGKILGEISIRPSRQECPELKITRGITTVMALGTITLEVSNDVYDVIRGSDTETLKRCVIRYSMLGFGTGMFWGVVPEVVKLLDNPLECFASPFNANCDEYCTAFADDCKLTSDKTCHENFFTYIQELNEARTLIFNPPYTNLFIRKALSALTEYLSRVPDARVLLMLPDWSIPEMKEFLERDDVTHSKIKNAKVYDFISKRNITPDGVGVVIATIGLDHQRILSQL